MKGSKVNQEKRSAENWVEIAKTFGEKCIAIQHDNKLTLDQKLEKQKAITKELIQEIHDDAYLKKEEKQAMTHAIQSYITDWAKMHEILKNSDSDIFKAEKKKQK